PLAIHHACDYIAQTKCSVEEYIDILHRDARLWTDESLTPIDYAGNLLRTATLSLELLEMNDSFRLALAMMAISAEGPLPVSLFTQIFGDETSNILASLTSGFSINFDKNQSTLFLHQMVRKAIQVFCPVQWLQEAYVKMQQAMTKIIDSR